MILDQLEKMFEINNRDEYSDEVSCSVLARGHGEECEYCRRGELCRAETEVDIELVRFNIRQNKLLMVKK